MKNANRTARHRSKQAWVAAMAAIAALPSSAWALTKITRVEFFGKSSPNQIAIVGDGPIEYEKIENPDDKQVILEIRDAKLASSNAARRLDTASFDSKVSLISPYNVEGKNAVRIIVQMRENAPVSVVSSGSRLFMGVDGPADPNILGTSGKSAVAATGETGTADETGSAPAAAGRKSSRTGARDEVATSSSAGEAPAATPEGRIQQFLDASQTKRYIGRHITLQVKEADIVDVFKLIGETSGFNMVIGSDVAGKVSLSLVDVPWDLALDTILTTNKLGAERTGNVLRVAQLSTLTAEKNAQLQAKIAAENNAPRITRIFPLSYATGASLLPVLSRFGGGAAGTQGTGPRDTIIVDERTNSLIIQDTSDNLERMAKIIKLLDRQTPQVQIEAKMIAAQETFGKSLSGQFGINNTTSWGGTGASFLQGSTLSAAELPGTPGNKSPEGGNLLGMSLKIGALASTRLTALLSIAESEGKTKTISSPRTVVLNKQASTIVQGTPVLVPVTVQNPANGSSISSTEVRSANLSLNVTPTVTNDGNIVMSLTIANDSPVPVSATQTGISTRNMTTQVVAESGSTIAIGGIYTNREVETASGLPGLRKLPIIGALFGAEVKSLERNELFIFVTPRVLNEEVMNTDLEATPTAQSSALRRM